MAASLLAAEIALVGLAKNPQARTGLQGLLLARIEVEKAQQHEVPLRRRRFAASPLQGARRHLGRPGGFPVATGIPDASQQLSAWSIGDLAVDDLDFKLRRDARLRVANRRDPGFIFVAQRQMQNEIGIGAQTEPGQPGREGVGFLGVSQGRARRRPRPGRRAAIP